MSITPPPTRYTKSFWGQPQAIATIVVAVIVAIATIVVALISGDVIKVSAGSAIESTRAPGSAQSSIATPNPEPTERVKIRRVADLLIKDGYAVDLDSKDRKWDMQKGRGNEGSDFSNWGGRALVGTRDASFAVVSGPPNYETCQKATEYTPYVPIDRKLRGTRLCVRTSEGRYAFLTVKKALPPERPNQIALSVVVWERPSALAPESPASTPQTSSPEPLPAQNQSIPIIVYIGVAIGVVAAITILAILIAHRLRRSPSLASTKRGYGSVMPFLMGWLTAWDWAGLLPVNIQQLDDDHASMPANGDMAKNRYRSPGTIQERYGIRNGGGT